MKIKLQQLNHFVMVIEHGGFRAASQHANRSQAALSTSIKELEKILGQPLFEHGNKSKLTFFGENCLPKIQGFVNLYNELGDDLQAMAAGQRGRVRIASLPSVATRLVPDILNVFCKSHPNVKISLVDDNAVGIEARLLSGDVDVAIGNTCNIEDERIDFTPLLSDPIGVVCLKDNPIAKNAKSIDWSTLLKQPFIHNGTCSLLAGTPAHGLSEKALYSVENITSLFSVLALGIGVTTLPKLAFPVDDKKLVWIPLQDHSIKRQIGIFKLANRTISPQAQAFHDLSIQHLSSDAEPIPVTNQNTLFSPQLGD